MSDRTILLSDDGRVAADGPSDRILADVDLLSEHGLEPPAVARLFDDLDVDDRPVTVPEARRMIAERESRPSSRR